ncbi:hypothetical protein [Halocella sp. SP3-1]|uniref:hypothetical protein n=1 Tax=Halocella sp. SP3-1 TaxID=2382161 RepID=UPI002571139C|nr:hypothetical protein [Halocella sp. SP3-1]
MSARYVYLAMFIYIVIGCWLAYAARVDMKKDIMDYFLGGRSTGGLLLHYHTVQLLIVLL